jgi:hypothetical protein
MSFGDQYMYVENIALHSPGKVLVTARSGHQKVIYEARIGDAPKIDDRIVVKVGENLGPQR